MIQECSVHSLLHLLIYGWNKFLHARTFFTLADTTFIPMGVMYLHTRMFCTLAQRSSIPIGAINFYMKECFSHSLIPLLFPCLGCIYMQESSVTLARRTTSSIPMGTMSQVWKKYVVNSPLSWLGVK